MRVECSKCGNLDDTSARTVVLPEFLCRECTQATEDESVPETPIANQIYEDIFHNLNDSEMRTLIEQLKNEIPSLYPQGKKCACGHLDIPEVEDSDEMLADMQIQLERAQEEVRNLKEIQGLEEALIQDLKKQIELYKQRDHHHYYLVDEANNKIADLETSRDNERRRGDLYQGWYRETLHKYPAEMPELVGLLDEATNRLCSLLVRHGVRPAIWTW